MKKLLLLLLFIGLSANAQFLRSNLTREQYAENVDNYKPGSQVSVLLGKNTVELAYSYTDIITWGGSIERIQKDIVNDQKPFYAFFGSLGGEFEDVTITVKMGVATLKKMGSTENTTNFVYGGSFEYRVIPNLGIVIGSDSACDTLLTGLVYHFGDK
jgi:hypothetical protein